MTKATGVVLGGFVLAGVAYLVILPDDKRSQLVALARADVGKNLADQVWQEVLWKSGTGFVSALRLPVTTSPQPGDLAYKDKPNRHYAMVKTVSPFTTIDGNGPGGVVSEGPHSPTGYVFYSIEPLLRG